MNIVILGAGQVGKTLAENLSGEKHDICVVDSDASKLREIKERLDVATVLWLLVKSPIGHASHPSS